MGKEGEKIINRQTGGYRKKRREEKTGKEKTKNNNLN